MKKGKKFMNVLLVSVMFLGCAGLSRKCTSCWAGAAGADWVIVQMDGFGRVMRCWELHGVSVSNEDSSDGIYWKSEDGHLVHISGFYNRVQVDGGRWDAAFAEVGITQAVCSQSRNHALSIQPELETPDER